MSISKIENNFYRWNRYGKWAINIFYSRDYEKYSNVNRFRTLVISNQKGKFKDAITNLNIPFEIKNINFDSIKKYIPKTH